MALKVARSVFANQNIAVFRLICCVQGERSFLCTTWNSNMNKHNDDQSRNSWIKEDNPLSSEAMGQYKDGYEDILHERRTTSDLRFVTRSRDIPKYKYNKPRTPGEIKEHVYHSDRVKYTVEQVSKESGTQESEVWVEVRKILDEMAHEQSMRAIRAFAYPLTKTIKTLFKRLYVNEEGIKRMRSLIQEYPVLLMPSHRSYADFLLMSYVFYHYDLPLPVIAAAMDFMGMKGMGWLLRHSGAFYIRRSFGSDKLYWAVFTEYVQTQICNGDHPVEFYIEGTRSRTSKTYHPKIGMLRCALEPYFKAHVPDIMVMPISISYDRTLEESLYAYEILGIPKPKESTSGLLKASSILKEDFGNIHMHIGEPISIRQFSLGKINRVVHSLYPRYMVGLNQDEDKLMHDLAHHVELQQQKHMVISPWSMIAAVLMQSTEGLPLRQLVKEVEWLKRQVSNLGAYVDWPGNEQAEDVIRSCLDLHMNILTISPESFIELKLVKPPTEKHKAMVKDSVLINAATDVMVSLYRNQLLHVFVRVGLVATIVNACSQETMSLDNVYKHYEFLETLFGYEFIFQPGHTKQDFDEAIQHLTHMGGLSVEGSSVVVRKSINKYTTFLSQMFEPFILGYWVFCQYLLSLPSHVGGHPLAKKPKLLVNESQTLALRLLQQGIVKHYEVLSLDMLNNALKGLKHMSAITVDKRVGGAHAYPHPLVVSKISDQLGGFCELPSVSVIEFATEGKKLPVQAKL